MNPEEKLKEIRNVQKKINMFHVKQLDYMWNELINTAREEVDPISNQE